MRKKVLYNRFDGGMVESLRNARKNQCATVSHFDIFTDPHALRPNISTTDNNTVQTAIGNVIVGNDGLFYGLGTDVNNPTLGDIYKKATYSGAWAELANSKSGSAVEYSVFIDFKNYLYYLMTGFLVVVDRSGVGSIDNSTCAISWTNPGKPLIHPKDGVLYIPYDNKIASHTGATKTTVWNATALTLPDTRYKITCLAPWGNYLAIAIAPVNASAPLNSQVLLWDRDTSLATVSETIDWGQGSLQVLNNLNGVLVGVSDFGSGTENVYSDKLQIKVWSGGATPTLIKEYRSYDPTASTASVTVYPRVNFIRDDKMYFSADVYSAEPRKRGLWTVRKNELGEWAVAIERVGNTNNSSTTAVLAAAITGDRCVAVHTAAGTITITTSGGTVAYGTGTWTSQIIAADDPRRECQLVAVNIISEPLPSGASYSVLYRKNEETTFGTTIMNISTANTLVHEATTIESTGAALPIFRELQLEVQSSGGAVITGIEVIYDELETNKV